MKKITRFAITLLLISAGCRHETPVPKPRAMLRLEYPPAAYEKFDRPAYPFTFDKSVYARAEAKADTALNLYYPDMKARIYMTYAPVHGNLRKLLADADKLTYKHAVKADDFKHRIYTDPGHRVFARISLVTGNAASPLQFLVTDSTRHFVTGSLYFRSVPNYDSIRPPLEYIRRDVQRLVESWRWKD